MKDRRYDSNGNVIEEWERPGTIADDWYYDQEENAYYAPGEPYYWKPDETKTPAMLQEIEEYWRQYEERQAVRDREEAERRQRIMQMQKSPAGKPKRREQPSLFGELDEDGAD